MPPRYRSFEDYFIPGSDRVLRNKLGLSSSAQLSEAEEALTKVRLVELFDEPVVGAFDFAHMQEVHRRIFQDVYDWAGQPRAGGHEHMFKAGPNVVDYALNDPDAPRVSYRYFPAASIEEGNSFEYRRLKRANYLTGLDQDAFAEGLADHWAEINTVHAFREGNTRSQFVFFSQLTEHAGYRLDAEQFKKGAPLRDEFVAARFAAQATARSDRLADVLRRGIEPLRDVAAEQERSDAIRSRARRFPELFQEPQTGGGRDISLEPGS